MVPGLHPRLPDNTERPMVTRFGRPTTNWTLRLQAHFLFPECTVPCAPVC